MAYTYTSRAIAELAHQLALSPRHLRSAQIAGIEKMLTLIEPDQVYPYEWVVFQITGRKCPRTADRPPIVGETLIADVTTLAEEFTRRGAPTRSSLAGEYRTHDELSAELDVSAKTVRRWRTKGLLGVRVVGDDGVTRLVFSRSSIDLFKRRHADLVARGASFTLLTDEERANIVALARVELAERREKMHVVARAVSAKTGRAVETIRYTLRQFDAANPTDTLFARGDGPVVSPSHLAIWKLHQAGQPAAAIAKAQDTDVKSVLAVIREMEARSLKDERIDYMDNALFHAPNADELIVDAPRPAAEELGRSAMRAPQGLPPYLKALYAIPLLSREQEADLFRRYNYLRFAAARAVAAMDVHTVGRVVLDNVRDRLAQAEAIKNEIIQANLRLVVSIAKRHVGPADNLFELISDGNMSLIAAAERFDFSLGNKFSTYASWAIMKNFARSVPEARYHRKRYVTGQDEMLDATSKATEESTSGSDLAVIRAALSAGMEQLNDREQTIVREHFGLSNGGGTTKTLEELGQQFGVTKERIRQIEKRAMDKLREALSPGLLQSFVHA
ncbi:MAG: sigma-70 family RNA polymerase sigma factor [Phycisphaerales bacterium]|nr:sigma-70 family RNA polymerase sigma factor [Phycisphaerales bacterium]